MPSTDAVSSLKTAPKNRPSWEMAGGAAASGSRSTGCDRDDGYRPCRLPLVGGVAVAVVCVDERRETLVARIRWVDDPGRGRWRLSWRRA